MLTGRVLAPDGKPATGMKIFRPSRSQSEEPVLSLHLPVRSPEKKENTRSTACRRTSSNLSVTDQKEEWVFRPMQDLLIQTGDKLDLDLNLEAGVLVSGRVFDPEGKPLAGASPRPSTRARKTTPALPTPYPTPRALQAPPSGRYSPMYFNATPDGFAYPDRASWKLWTFPPVSRHREASISHSSGRRQIRR